MKKMLKQNLFIIYVMTFMDLFAIGLTFPVLYGHVRSLGGSNFFIGVLGSTYSTIQVLSGPIIGSWSDIRGRKPVLTATLVICSICYFLLGITNSVYMVLVLRIILGFSKHTQTICKALIADFLPHEEHAAVLGRSAAFGAIGFVVGPVIGGHLMEITNGFFYISFLTSTLFIINIVVATFITIEEADHKNSPKKSSANSTVIKSIYKESTKVITELRKVSWTNFWDAFLLRFCFGLSVSMYFSKESLYLQDKFQISQKEVGYIISFLSTIGMLSSFLLGYIKETFYKRDVYCYNRLLHGFALFATCFLGLGVSPNIYVYLVFLIPFSVASSVLRNVSMELIIQRSGETEKGSLSGASNSVMSIARSMSPIISAITTDVYGEKSVIFAAFFPCLIGTVLCSVLKYKKDHIF